MPEKFQTVVFLVRHGQTDHFYSRDRAIDDQRQLTELGIQQSRLVGRFLDQFLPSTIYSSPLERCQATAKLIQAEINPQPPVVTAKSLVEVYSAVAKIRQEVGERGESVFTTVLGEHRGEQVVAVTHQYIIGYIIADFLAVEYDEVPCDPADVYRIVFADQTLVEATRLQPAKALENKN